MCNMIKVAFCDDDLSILNQISVMLDKYRVKQNQEIVYTAFCNPLDLLAEIEKGICYDVLFLDVIMPGQNGMNVAKEIREYDTNVKIIFLTSSSEFAVESYAVGAYFYQLKPIWEESFWRLMDSAVLECEKHQQDSLILRCKNGITRIEINKLEYCEVIGRTLLFHLEGGKVYERLGSMDELYVQLMEYENFLRPHRSYLVNMDYIQTLSYKAITMSNLAEVPVPRGKYSEMKEKYLEYAFHRKQVF